MFFINIEDIKLFTVCGCKLERTYFIYLFIFFTFYQNIQWNISRRYGKRRRSYRHKTIFMYFFGKGGALLCFFSAKYICATPRAHTQFPPPHVHVPHRREPQMSLASWSYSSRREFAAPPLDTHHLVTLACVCARECVSVLFESIKRRKIPSAYIKYSVYVYKVQKKIAWIFKYFFNFPPQSYFLPLLPSIFIHSCNS